MLYATAKRHKTDPLKACPSTHHDQGEEWKRFILTHTRDERKEERKKRDKTRGQEKGWRQKINLVFNCGIVLDTKEAEQHEHRQQKHNDKSRSHQHAKDERDGGEIKQIK